MRAWLEDYPQALGALLALLAIASRPGWLLLRTVVTIAHEGGHALVAVAVGRRLAGVRLHSDTSGVTLSRGRPTGPGMIATAAAGYPAPCLLGLGYAWLADTERADLVLWVSVVLLVVLGIQVRNAYGLLAVTVVCGGLFAVSFFAPLFAVQVTAAALAWLLLLGGLRAVGELRRRRHYAGAENSDADQLGRLTHVPGTLWVLAFAAVGLACLLQSGVWLVTAG